VGLVVVFVLLAGFLWLLRRGTFSLAKRGPRQELALETAISLGERRSLIIVAVEGRRLLLGASPGQVSLITELEPSPAPSFGASLDAAVVPGEQGSRR
jgi:flagellar protein FliO/FliZ